MGLFNELGRHVEQFKQDAKEAAAEEADYRCRACEARFSTDHDRCPECGARETVSKTTGE